MTDKMIIRTRLATLALLIAATGLLIAACGSSETEVTSSQTTDSMETDTNISAESAAAVTEQDVEIGSNVGQMVPAFYFNDADSTKVTSDELFARGRPSFFYFFTTW